MKKLGLQLESVDSYGLDYRTGYWLNSVIIISFIVQREAKNQIQSTLLCISLESSGGSRTS